MVLEERTNGRCGIRSQQRRSLAAEEKEYSREFPENQRRYEQGTWENSQLKTRNWRRHLREAYRNTENVIDRINWTYQTNLSKISIDFCLLTFVPFLPFVAL